MTEDQSMPDSLPASSKTVRAQVRSANSCVAMTLNLTRETPAGTVGGLVGELEFEVIVIPPSTLTEFIVSELFVMEAEGTIIIEELVA